MVTGFAAGGLVDLVPALAVMLGANVGTTLIVKLLAFDVAEVVPLQAPVRSMVAAAGRCYPMIDLNWQSS
jgi:phosphate:Na+ symporter